VQVRRRDRGLRRQQPLREQRARQPGQDVTGARGGEPRGPGRVDEHRVKPVRRRDHRRGALEQHAGAELGGGQPRVLDPAGRDVRRVLAEQPPEFARVRGEQGGRGTRQQVLALGEQRQPVRVHQHRQARGQHRRQPRRGGIRGAHPGARDPRLHSPDTLGEFSIFFRTDAAVSFQLRYHHLGPQPADGCRRGGRGDQPDHARAAADRAARGEQGGAGKPVTARQQAEDAAPVLVRLVARAGKQGPDVGSLRGTDVGGALQVRPEPDVDELDDPRMAGPRVDKQPRLERAERDGDVRPYRGAVHRAGVGVDAAWQVDGYGGRARGGGELGQRRGRLAQAAAAADAEHPVDDQVRAADRVPHVVPRVVPGGDVRPGVVGAAGLADGDDPAAPALERRAAAGVDLVPGLDRGHRRAAPGEQRAGVQRVAAVISRAREHHDPRAVDPARAAQGI
jgi:hypothetical protein